MYEQFPPLPSESFFQVNSAQYRYFLIHERCILKQMLHIYLLPIHSLFHCR
jgi:hypothetical protein